MIGPHRIVDCGIVNRYMNQRPRIEAATKTFGCCMGIDPKTYRTESGRITGDDESKGTGVVSRILL